MRILVYSICVIGCLFDYKAGGQTNTPQVVDSIPRLVSKDTPLFKVKYLKDGQIYLNEKQYSSISAFDTDYKLLAKTNAVVWFYNENPSDGVNFSNLYYKLYLDAKPGIEVRMSWSSNFTDVIEEQKALKAHIEMINNGSLKIQVN